MERLIIILENLKPVYYTVCPKKVLDQILVYENRGPLKDNDDSKLNDPSEGIIQNL